MSTDESNVAAFLDALRAAESAGADVLNAWVGVCKLDQLRGGLRAMVARWPEFGEHIFRTLLARRAWHEAEGHGVMRIIAPRGSRRAASRSP